MEIKCPLPKSTQGLSSIPYLKCVNGKYHLKRSHSHYSQIQWEMFSVDVSYGWFFVCISNDCFHMERIERDQLHLDEMIEASVYFFNLYIVPYIRDTLAVVQSNVISPDVNNNEPLVVVHLPPSVESKRRESLIVSKRPKKRKRQSNCGVKMPLFVCKKCEEEVLYANDITTDKDNSVQCDGCENWFHWCCVNLTSMSKDTEWLCADCDIV